MDSSLKKTEDTNTKGDASLKHSNTSISTVSKGEKLIQDIPTIFKNAPDHKKLWNSIHHEKWRLSLAGNYDSSEASRVLQGLENAVNDNTNIQEYCQQKNVQKILKKNEKLQKSLERIIEANSISQKKEAIDITERLKQLQDLPSYQSDQKVPPSDHTMNTQKKVMEDIIKEGQDLNKLINSHRGRPLPEHLTKYIHELLDRVPDQYDTVSRHFNEDDTKIPSDKGKKALDDLKGTAYVLSIQRTRLEQECIQQISGNTDLRNVQKLKLAGWGEQHHNKVHHKRCAELIEDFARNGNVIVLVEGINAGTAVDIEDNEVTRKLPQDIKKNISVYGWDDLDLVKKAHDVREAIKSITSPNEYIEAYNKSDDITIKQRNKALLDNLDKMIQQHNESDTKFIIIAGRAHFEDEILQKGLEKYNYALVKSAYEERY